MNRVAILVAVLFGLATAALVVVLLGSESEDQGPIEVVREQRLNDRVVEFTLRTPSLPIDAAVSVFLPQGYEDSEQTYPVLYLLHGAGGDAGSWISVGVGPLLRDLPLVVVMPDADTGFYADWFDTATGADPRWETFHIDELIPWVEDQFRVSDEREGRAVAGASMGGLGAAVYAARHPDLFSFAASISGPVSVKPGPMGRLLATTGRDPVLAEQIWGPYPQEAERWRAHDPVDRAELLADVELVLSVGNGRLPGRPDIRDPVEIQIRKMNEILHKRLLRLGIDHHWDGDRPGIHEVTSSVRAFGRTLRLMMQTLQP